MKDDDGDMWVEKDVDVEVGSGNLSGLALRETDRCLNDSDGQLAVSRFRCSKGIRASSAFHRGRYSCSGRLDVGTIDY